MPGGFALPAPYAYRCPIRHCDERRATAPAWRPGFDLFDQASVGAPAAVVAEPVLSAGGVIVPPPGYFARLLELCDEREMLPILDECQTGLGRLGGCTASRSTASCRTSSCSRRRSAAAIPIGAVVTSATIEEECHARGFMHVTSHVSDPLPAAAALACSTSCATRTCRRARRARARACMGHLRELQSRHELIGDVRGHRAAVRDRARRGPRHPRRRR